MDKNRNLKRDITRRYPFARLLVKQVRLIVIRPRFFRFFSYILEIDQNLFDPYHTFKRSSFAGAIIGPVNTNHEFSLYGLIAAQLKVT